MTREIKYSYLLLFDDGGRVEDLDTINWRLYDIEIVTRRSDGEVASLENLLLDLIIDIFPSGSHNKNRGFGESSFLHRDRGLHFTLSRYSFRSQRYDCFTDSFG